MLREIPQRSMSSAGVGEGIEKFDYGKLNNNNVETIVLR